MLQCTKYAECGLKEAKSDFVLLPNPHDRVETSLKDDEARIMLVGEDELPNLPYTSINVCSCESKYRPVMCVTK